MTGICRKLPDTERARLKKILKKSSPRTPASSCARPPRAPPRRSSPATSTRLTAQWEDIAAQGQVGAARPALLHGEPDLAIKVVRDVFNEDFHKLVVVRATTPGTPIEDYVARRRPATCSTASRSGRRRTTSFARVPRRRADREGAGPQGVAALRRLAGHRPHRGDDRRRRQHRQVRRLRAATSRRRSPGTTSRPPRRSCASCGCATSAASSSSTSSTWCSRPTATSCCAGWSSASAATAPSTRSPRSPRSGLVQMTRKRIGQGLLEVFSEPCEHCTGRGVIVHPEPVESKGHGDSASVATVVRSASASLGAAKVHAAARRAAAAGEEPAAEDATAEPTPDEVEAKPRAGRGRRRAATRAQAAPDAGAHDAAGADGQATASRAGRRRRRGRPGARRGSRGRGGASRAGR